MSGNGGNLSGSRLSVIPVDGGELQPGPGSANDESTLDVEDVSALVPEAHIDVYEAPGTVFGFLDQYTQMVNADVDQVLTTSWLLGCEQLTQLGAPGYQQAENFLFEQAATQGQTVFAAAGDTGDDTCNSFRAVPEPPGQNLLSLADPASQPYVVSAGGTTMDNATQPPSEHVWNDGASWGGSGGGVSESWAMPSWQRQLAQTTLNSDDVTNGEALETADASYSAPFTTPTFCDGTLGLAPGTPCREGPDVSAQADEFTGAITIFGQSLGYGPANGWATIGGTSSAAPLWAAMLALVNSSSSCSGDIVNGAQDVGFASPILYGIAASPSAYAASFNDITSGNNDIYGLDNGLSYPARTGYDMASGLGTPQLTTPSGGNGLAFYMCGYATVLTPPVVTSLSPRFGSTAGGETVTVTGSGFGTNSAPLVKSVQVGGGFATSFSVTNNTTLQVTLPAAPSTTAGASPDPTEDGAGPAHIVVTATNGQSSVPSASSVFEYVDESAGVTVPSVTSVSPYGGVDTAPATVTVFGSGFAPSPTPTVKFGGVAGTNVKVLNTFELTVTPPLFTALSPATACPMDNGHAGQPLNATSDVCQVEVTVTENGHTSTTATILPPYEGPLTFNEGAEVLPVGCGCEDEPQTSEYDYSPAPTITSVSTGTIGDLPGSAAELASEFGGATSNTVTVKGTGMDPLTFSYATLGLPTSENSIFFPLEISGTSFVLEAPPILGIGSSPTTGPVGIPVGATSLAGTTSAGQDGTILYAGVPVVTSAVDSATGENAVPDSSVCSSPPPAGGCGAPLRLSGAGFLQVTGPIGFVDNITGTSLGLQNTYTQVSDTKITTQSVQQNPDVVDVEVCSNTGCSFNPPKDFLFVYPPGNPSISSLSPTSGPAHGGNQVVIDGNNLGCVVSVSFGSVTTFHASNSQALLDCGQTSQVVVTAPPGALGAVPVKIVTVESEFTGSSSNSASYTYRPSSPSAPAPLQVTPGAAEATLKWSPPASDGGETVLHYDVTATSIGRRTVAASVPAGSRSYSFRYLQPGVTWTFSVRAVSAHGAGLPETSLPISLRPGDNGYLVATANGAVFGFGSLASSGGSGGGRISGHVVSIATTPDALGYFEVTSTGAVYSFGNAEFYGQASLPAGSQIVGIAATGTGRGYWLVSNTGKVFAFGDAAFEGSAKNLTDVIGIAPTLSGHGYYLAGADGTVKVFGDAVFHGGEAGKVHHELVAIAVNAVTGGYWLLTSSGGIFAFNHAGAYGSLPGDHLKGSVVGMVGTPDGHGYWVEGRNNAVFAFGAARYTGNAGGQAQSSGVGIATA